MNSQLKINIAKGSGIGGYGVRNYYSFENAYGVNNVGTVKTTGVGHLDSSSMASIVLTASSAAMTGTYSTVHYY